jgi:MFS family permease
LTPRADLPPNARAMSNPTTPQSRFALGAAGAAFFGLFLPFAWVVVTIITAGRAADHRQDEAIGYMMFLTGPTAGLVGAIAGFFAGYRGPREQWPRRWAIVGVVGVLLAVVFNVYMLHTTGPDSRPRAHAPG